MSLNALGLAIPGPAAGRHLPPPPAAARRAARGIGAHDPLERTARALTAILATPPQQPLRRAAPRGDCGHPGGGAGPAGNEAGAGLDGGPTLG